MTTTERKALASKMATELATNNYHAMFDALKALEAEGKQDSDEFKALFAKYAKVFKSVRGYTPHWVR